MHLYMQIISTSLLFVESERMYVISGNTYSRKHLVDGSDQSLNAPCLWFLCTFKKGFTIDRLILRAPEVTEVVMVNAEL